MQQQFFRGANGVYHDDLTNVITLVLFNLFNCFLVYKLKNVNIFYSILKKIKIFVGKLNFEIINPLFSTIYRS